MISNKYFINDAFGPIDAADLLEESGGLSSAYSLSNAVKDTLSLRGSRRSLIVGRKGSGKTTLLHMANSSSTSINCILDIGGEFPSVVEALSKETRTRFTEPAARIWSTVIWNTIILNVHDELKDELKQLENTERLLLNNYVKNLEAKINSNSPSTLTKVTRDVSDRMSSGSIGLAAAMIRAAFENDIEVDDAISCVNKLLKIAGKSTCVFIDTMEFYGIQTGQAANDCIRGLLNCCARIHRESKNIECKLFFPDELTQHVKSEISSSVLKDFRDVQYLRWDSSELIRLAALRLRDRLGAEALPAWRLIELGYEDTRKAQTVFHRFLPTLVSNDRGAQFEVLSYLLRHTQRTPRQFLLLLNTLSSSYFYFDGSSVSHHNTKLTEQEVLAVVDRCAQEIYTDILATYREIYPNLGKIISRILPRLGRTFEDDDLIEVFKTSSIAEDFGVDFEDLKSSLSDVGAVGVVDRYKSNTNSVHCNFSYMTDQRLLLSASDLYGVHPIFSSVYKPMKDSITVYPSGSSVNDD